MILRDLYCHIVNKKNVKATKIHIAKNSDVIVSKKSKVINGHNLSFGCKWNRFDKQYSYLSLSEDSKLEVKGSFYIYSGARISVKGNLELNTGYINSNVNITCENSIYIGDDVAIGPGVCIRDSDSHAICNADSNVASHTISKPIHIGDHVWLGERCMVLKGVKIGAGAIVAAGAIVTKDVPPNSIVAGVPAKVIRTNVTWK